MKTQKQINWKHYLVAGIALTAIGLGSFAVETYKTLTAPIDGQALLAKKEALEKYKEVDEIRDFQTGILLGYSNNCNVAESVSTGCAKMMSHYDQIDSILEDHSNGEITTQEAYFRFSAICNEYPRSCKA